MEVRRKRCDDRNRGSESERDLKSEASALEMKEGALNQGVPVTTRTWKRRGNEFSPRVSRSLNFGLSEMVRD